MADPLLDVIREGLPSTAATIYLNAGSMGPLPRPAAEAMRAHVTEALERGRVSLRSFEAMLGAYDAARQAIAEALGSDAERIALAGSATNGMNLALSGLDLRAGDEIVTSDGEHPGLDEPLAVLAHRHGVVVRRAPLVGGGDALEAIEPMLGPRTRVVALSHVLWGTGRILPVADIAAAARRVGALSLIDGAQSVGAMAVRPESLGVDLYAVPGQKWLLGPSGTGGLWVRSGLEEVLEPASPGYLTRDRKSEGAPQWPGARRFDAGTISTTALIGLAAAVEWRREAIGWETGFERTAAAGRRVRERLAAVEGLNLIDPGGEASQLVSFTLGDADPEPLHPEIEERGVTLRWIPAPRALRVSAAFWTSEEDVERLAGVLADVAVGVTR